ncbi:MAG: GNAT family N-acetyltransferase [Candidatus Bathyarchaeota archaeon]|nr:GNAT family N-acetyltransferase [Candidatus Bathyarchaeota archaeon]
MIIKTRVGMVEFCIEEANVEDAHDILAVQRLAFQSEAERYGDFKIPPLLETQEELETKIKTQLILKATVNGEIVGSVRVEEKDDACHVGRLIVHPNFQNQGIATQLLKEIERRFPLCHKFELFTGDKSLKNIYLYEKLGYKKVSATEQADKITLIFLRKTR